ncbi:hypothetical protein J7E25_09840 [Agromyces sp. ISL-38]|uniref:hypothetical protein n=1 Tax=Agromyces sp. ISL-38 TaxID=2819107 RepID=UPI001BECD2F4|nr:hypothetical protein [Agromyces sp. ISL-38]
MHGQDDARKYELESYLQEFTDEPPIILHQQPNGGRVVIEKFEDIRKCVATSLCGCRPR